MSFSVTVNAVDANWNVDNTNTDMVRITSSDANAILPANAALILGTKSFSVTLATAGTSTITANDVGGALTIDTSPQVTVNADVFSQLQILLPGETAAPGTATGTAGVPSIQAADVPFTVTVNAVDNNWNFVNNAMDTVNLTSSDLQFVAPAPASLLSGTVNFNVTLFTLDTAAIITANSTILFPSSTDSSDITVVNPVPAIGSLSPSSIANGNPAFTLTINGSNFVPASQVLWTDGTPRTTTFVSTTQLTATINAADVVNPGNNSVTVRNPTPGGGTSNAGLFAVGNPVPVLTSINPASATAGTGAFTLTLTGSGFISASVVKWSGQSDLTPVSQSGTQLTVTVPASYVATTGIINVSVFNPTPVGGTSATQTFTVNATNPAPVLASINPISTTAGGLGFALTVNGSNFVVNSSVVQWNGTNRVTTFVSANQLTAAITPADIAIGNIANVTVFNPTPGGGTSAAQTFTANSPVPILSNINPASNTAGSSGFTLIATGSGFVANSVLLWNGASRSTTLLSPTQLAVTIPATDIASAGSANVTVFNPGPGGGTTAVQSFTITNNNPAPTLANILPASATVGGAAFILTFTGTNFVPSGNSVVQWKGANRPTTFISDTQLTAAIPASDIAAVGSGSASVTVFNILPGGGTSAAQTFTINPGPFAGLQILLPGESAAPGTATGKTGTPTPQVAGIAFNVIVNAVDANWNVATAISDTVAITSSDPNAVLPANTALSNSTQTLSVTLKTAGTATLTASDSTTPTMAANTSPSVTVNAGAFTQLQLLVPGETAAPGSVSGKTGTPNPQTIAIAFNVNVNAVDACWNLLNTVTDVVGITTNGNAILPANAALVNGSQAFSVTFNTAGTQTITANDVTTPSVTANTSSNIIVNNPTPDITSFNPLFVTAGDVAFTLTVDGTNFITGAAVQWNGSARTTIFVSSTQLTASILASDIASAGADSITVANPVPAAAPSQAVIFTVNNPVPFLTSISPPSGTAGGTGFTLTATGSNFVTTSSVQWNGSNRTTTYVSPTQLTAAILASDIASVGSANVTVFNPLPAGGTSAAQAFTINATNLQPTITSLNPSSDTAGSLGFNLTVNGTNFVSGASQVLWNGASRTTTFVTATQLTAAISASDIATAGSATVTVFNPAPGGGTTIPALTFTINATNPVPTLTSTNPSSATAGSLGFNLTVTGTNFVIGNSLVNFNGAGTITTFVSSTQLTAAIPSGDITSNGNFNVFVINPGQVQSGNVIFNVTATNPVSTLTSISQTTANAGDPSFNLTLTGTGFVINQSVVQWNGANRTTTFVDSTHLTAYIPATDLANGGTPQVTVFNPGQPSSNALTFTINNLAPALTSINPTSANTNGAAFVMTVNGSNFVNSSVLNWSGQAGLVPFSQTSTQLIVNVPAGYIVAGGTPSLSVVNPIPGGGASLSLAFTVNNLTPTLGTLATASAISTGPGFPLTLNGSNFVSNSIVQWSGQPDLIPVTSTTTQLMVNIPASYIATAGTANITVVNPLPGGGTSAAASFTINPTLPTLSNLAPLQTIAGGALFPLTLTGTNFVPSSVVQWSGQASLTPAATPSSTQLTVNVPVAYVALAGIENISVFNPGPGGGVSTSLNFTIENPVPVLSAIAPTSATTGGQPFVMTLTGLNFAPACVLNWSGQADLVPIIQTATQLNVVIPASYIGASGIFSISVTNPVPGGGVSAAQTFTVNNPVPVLNGISSVSGTVGGPGFSLSLSGSNFVNGALVNWQGHPDLTPIAQTSTLLTLDIPASYISALGAFAITVTNPPLAGGVSGTQTFTVNPPAPVITSATADSASAGIAYTYTITATNSPTAFTAAVLPAGLSLNSATGVISGITAVTGTSTVALSASNSGGTGVGTLTLTVNLTSVIPLIYSPLTATGSLGQSFTYSILATSVPTQFNAVNLPPGFSIDTSSGIISGLNSSGGIFDVTLSATNAQGTGQALLQITIGGDSGAANIVSTTSASGEVGVPFQFGLSARGETPITFSATGLPAGLALSGSIIGGTPTTAGLFNVTVNASNAAGGSTQALALIIFRGSAGLINPNDPNSAPFAGSPPGAPLALTVSKLGIKLNFARAASDSITMSGVLPIPGAFVAAGQGVAVDIGGVVQTFNLNSKGTAVNGGNSFKMRVKATKGVVAAQNAVFSIKLSKGAFAPALAVDGLTNTDVKNLQTNVPVLMLFNSKLYGANQAVFYSAKQGKTGVTRN